MTDREGIIRLATEVMGWKRDKVGYPGNTGGTWFRSKTGNLRVAGFDHPSYTFNPFESIADAYELESAIPEAKRRLYSVILNRIVTDETPHELVSWGTLYWIAHATPRQRAEAALAVLEER